jgi:DNA polymerase
MARCAVLGIPATLENAGHVLGLPIQKDKAGHANMLMLAKPKTITPEGVCVWNDTPERLALQYAYCRTDVVAETGIDERVPPLSARERAVWELDQKINDRGIRLDIPTIEAARLVVEAEKKRLDSDMAAVTGGAVTAVSQVKRLTDWIKARSIPCQGLGKDMARQLAYDVARAEDAPVSQALSIRKEGAKASTAKLGAMLACACKDDRARGLLAYHGTSTGRWAGRLIQPQNLYRVDYEEDGLDVDATISLLVAQHAIGIDPNTTAASIRVLTGQSAMVMLAKCLRSMFIAAPGMRFVGGDLSNIEGRVAAWITGEQWKTDAFRAYDEKRGPDLYRVAYARSFGVADPATVTGAKRQVGKVTELSLQYQGSVGAWIKMAANYGVTPSQVVPVVREAVGADRWRQATEVMYPGATDKHALPAEEWAAVKLIVMGWREAHPRLVQGWWDLQDAAIEAVANPGAIVPVLDGKVRYLSARGFLWCALPSGRTISYFNPRVVTEDTSYFETDEGVRIKVSSLSPREMDEHIEAGHPIIRQSRKRVDYEGYEGEKKRWATMNLYGGMQFNHIVQGTARDIMVDGMLEADKRGYPIVLTVHDELLTECPRGFGSAEELEHIMAAKPEWVDGDLPLAAKAWEDERYAK